MTKWIQKTKLKKGALRRQLGIKEGERIPRNLLDKIIAAKEGEKITNPSQKGKRIIKVTRLLERRSIFARNLRNIKR